MPGGANTRTMTLIASAPLRLDGGTGWWLVQSGEVDLFAVALDHGEMVGPRYPVCRVVPGELIAALRGNVDHTVIAVGHLDTSLSVLARRDLASWPVEKQAERINRWLTRLA